MQALAWLGFVIGLGVLLITGSSVIKTLLIPRNLSSVIGTAVAASVLAVYRMVTAKIHDDVRRRERIYASGAPTYLFALLVCWIVCLYVAYTLMLLPFAHHSVDFALRLSGSSLFTLGFADTAGAAPYGIVFAAAISGLGVIALMIGYLPTLYAAYNRRETLVIMLEALSGKPPSDPAAGPAGADQEHLVPAQALRAVDRVGGRHIGKPHDVPDPDLLQVPLSRAGLAAGPAFCAGRRRAAAFSRSTPSRPPLRSGRSCGWDISPCARSPAPWASR